MAPKPPLQTYPQKIDFFYAFPYDIHIAELQGFAAIQGKELQELQDNSGKLLILTTAAPRAHNRIIGDDSQFKIQNSKILHAM